MNYKIKNKLNKPISKDPNTLFEYAVSVLVQKMNKYYTIYPITNDFRTHKQWANIIFGSGDNENSTYLSMITSSFGTYLRRNGLKYKWDFDKIYLEHKHIFEIEEHAEQPSGADKIIKELIHSIDDEIREAKRQTQQNTFKILELDTYKVSPKEEVYVAVLDLEDDDEPKIIEGLSVEIRIGGLSFDGKVLEFDSINSKVYFDCSFPLLTYQGDKKLIIDAVWLLEKIRDKLSNFPTNDLSGLPIDKFISNKCVPEKIVTASKFDLNRGSDLDISQKEAVSNSISNDVTLIWGPPGTGKSYTLGFIIRSFFQTGEKTLVSCIANVAVDAITKKFIELIEKSYSGQNNRFANGSVLRVGHTKDVELLNKDYLFPNNLKISNLRADLKELKNKLTGGDLTKQDKLLLKKSIETMQEQLKNEINSLIQKAILIFATASKVHVDTNFEELEFDNLIIDEASMMSVPHFVALTKNVKKRIIITGDFRQLGPVVLSQTALAQKWLYKDIFQFAGVNTRSETITHRAINQLLVQRRSHPNICKLINRPFYQGKLETEANMDKHNKVIGQLPFPDRVICYVNCRDEKNYLVERTKKGSRYNRFSADEIGRIVVKSLKANPDFSIGIITPYRGQVKLISEKIGEINLPSSIKNKVKIGTIHSFQGSETDVVIFDLVDSKHGKIGRLYQHDTGRRLINVALSRAKSKLVVVGDLEIFLSGTGSNNVDSAVAAIAQNIKRYENKM